MNRPISILGFGAWGGALSIHLARNGMTPIYAWEYLAAIRDQIKNNKHHPNLGPHGGVPEGIQIVDRFDALPLKDSVLFLAVASDYLAATLKQLPKNILKENPPYACVILTKGLEPGSLEFFHHIVQTQLKLPSSDIFVLTGPTIAKELLAGAPTRALLAGPANQKRNTIAGLLGVGNFHIDTSADLIGAQIGGSMKNIYAIGYGILEALESPANARAFYFLKAMDEMAIITQKLGGKQDTAFGPAGLGDLLTTSLSPNSRNSKLGRLLAEGKPLAQIQQEIGMATEGVAACEAYLKLARAKQVQLPLAHSIQSVLIGTLKAKEFLLGLGRRDAK